MTMAERYNRFAKGTPKKDRLIASAQKKLVALAELLKISGYSDVNINIDSMYLRASATLGDYRYHFIVPRTMPEWEYGVDDFLEKRLYAKDKLALA